MNFQRLPFELIQKVFTLLSQLRNSNYSVATAKPSVADSTEFTMNRNRWCTFQWELKTYRLIVHLTVFFKETVGELNAQTPSIENTA